MKVLRLTIQQRLNMAGITGARQDPPPALFVNQRIWEKLRLTEEEQTTVKAVAAPGGRVTWNIPLANAQGPKEIEFENEEAAKLKAILKAWPHYSVASGDHEWLKPVLAALDFEEKAV